MEGIVIKGCWIIAAGVCAAACVPSLVSAQIPCGYEVTHIIQAPSCGFGQFPPTIGTGISPDGRYVCGYWSHCFGSGDEAWVFDTQTGLFQTLPRPQNVTSAAAADVSNAGLIVGTYDRTGVGFRGFIYDLSSGDYVTEIPTLNPSGLGWSAVNAINESGQCCGYRSIGSEGDSINPYNAFIYDTKSGEFTDFGVMNGQSSNAGHMSADGVVSGTIGLWPTTALAFLWDGATLNVLPPIPGGISSSAGGVNVNHHVVGAGAIPSGSTNLFRGFRWNGRDMQLLLPPPDSAAENCTARDIADNGIAVGDYGPINTRRACVWGAASEAVDLNSFIDPASELSADWGRAINGSGEIVVQGSNSDGDVVAIVLTPVQRKLGDVNCDASVNIDDIFLVIKDWGLCNGCPTDFTLDAVVNINDLMIVIENWDF